MQNLNPWETRLQSWTPRAPSPGIKRRLFAPRRTPAARWNSPALWGRLAPALGCLLLTMVVAANYSTTPPDRGLSDLASYYVQTAGSNQPPPVSYPVPLTLEHNVFARFPSATFEWTNQSPFPSTTGSFLLLKTNSL